MAASTELTSVKCVMKLNNGTTETGNVKTVSVSLATLDKTQWATTQLTDSSNQKLLNIINAAYPCLSLMLYSATTTMTYDLSEN